MTSTSQHHFVFPILDKDEDFIITNYVGPEEITEGFDDSVNNFEIPFGNISKVERLGRIADWTGLSTDAHQQRGSRQRPTAITNTQAKAEEEEEGWSLSLGNNSSSMAAFGASAAYRRPAIAKPVRGAAAGSLGGSRHQSAGGFIAGGSRGNPRRPWNPRAHDRIREPSIKVGQDWKIVEEIEFSRLTKLQVGFEGPTVLATAGSVNFYDRSFDKIKAKVERAFPSPTNSIPIRPISLASHDEFMLEMARKQEATIFTTDVIASLLMACPRTVYPWDIVVKRVGHAIFLDARPDSNLNLIQVNETANEAPSDDVEFEPVNNCTSLSIEATKVNEAVLPFVTKTSGAEATPLQFDMPAKHSIGLAYRYTKISLGDDAYQLVVRSQISSAVQPADSSAAATPHLALIKAFLEYDPKSGGMDWRQRLDSQRGAVFAHELKNNGALTARWIYQAILGHLDLLKIAYVSRINPRNPHKHALLGLHEFDPFDLALQMNLNIPNGVGIVRALAEICLGLPEGPSYILVRDANKPLLRLYSIPQH